MENYIGIDLGGTTIKGGLVSGGTIIRKNFTELKKQGSEIDIITDIFNLIDSLWDENVAGIGFAVPALIDFQEGTVYGFSNIPQLENKPLKQMLENRFKVPVYLQNDANCFVLGEYETGPEKDLKNIIGLITDTGVGAGIILDGKLYNGTNYGAGEFGMIPYKNKSFKAYSSGQFFTRFYDCTGEELAILAQKGDAKAIDSFKEYGKNLGELIKLIGYALDPQVVTIGGSVSKSFPLYKESLFQSMDDYYFQREKNWLFSHLKKKILQYTGQPAFVHKKLKIEFKHEN